MAKEDAYMCFCANKTFIGKIKEGRMVQAVEMFQLMSQNGGINLAGLLVGSFVPPKNGVLIKLDRKSDYWKCYTQITSNLVIPRLSR